jgi:hypothetical protein
MVTQHPPDGVLAQFVETHPCETGLIVTDKVPAVRERIGIFRDWAARHWLIVAGQHHRYPPAFVWDVPESSLVPALSVEGVIGFEDIAVVPLVVCCTGEWLEFCVEEPVELFLGIVRIAVGAMVRREVVPGAARDAVSGITVPINEGDQESVLDCHVVGVGTHRFAKEMFEVGHWEQVFRRLAVGIFIRLVFLSWRMTPETQIVARLERIEGKLDALHEDLADFTLSPADLAALDRAEEDFRQGRTRDL